MYRAADQVARDMEDLMNLAPKLAKDDQGSKMKGKSNKEENVGITKTAAAVATKKTEDDEEDDDDEEWSPNAPPMSKTTNQQQRIVDDDDDELDLT